MHGKDWSKISFAADSHPFRFPRVAGSRSIGRGHCGLPRPDPIRKALPILSEDYCVHRQYLRVKLPCVLSLSILRIPQENSGRNLHLLSREFRECSA